MQANSIQKLITEIREEFDYSRGVQPSILDVLEDDEDTLYVIVSDRAEKSLMIGPGGRIAAELSKKLERKVTFYGQDELILRKHRLNLTLKRIDEVVDKSTAGQKRFLSFLKNLVLEELNYPRISRLSQHPMNSDVPMAVAYSGGTDSGATLIIANTFSNQVKAFTVNMGPRFIDQREMNRMKEFTSNLNVSLEIVENKEEAFEVLEKTEAGKIHPCGTCHEIIMTSVKRIMKEQHFDILLTGELLPTGRQSIEVNDETLIIHLPAALAFSKYRTRQVNNRYQSEKSNTRFGCAFLSDYHTMGWRVCGPSIFRVLRELQGGVLSTGEALELIKSILLPILKTKTEME